MYSISPPRLMNSRGRVLEDMTVSARLNLTRKRRKLAVVASSNACWEGGRLFGKASSGCQATKQTANQSAVGYDVRERGGVVRVWWFNQSVNSMALCVHQSAHATISKCCTWILKIKIQTQFIYALCFHHVRRNPAPLSVVVMAYVGQNNVYFSDFAFVLVKYWIISPLQDLWWGVSSTHIILSQKGWEPLV